MSSQGFLPNDTSQSGDIKFSFINPSQQIVNITTNDIGKVQADQLANAVTANPNLYNSSFVKDVTMYRNGDITPTELLNAYEYELSKGDFKGSQAVIQKTVDNTTVGTSPQGDNYVSPKTPSQLEQTAKRIVIMDRVSTHGGSPVTQSIDLSLFQNIKWAEIKVNLLANDPNALGTILPVDWRLSKITINDSTFYPTNQQSSTNVILNNQDNGALKNVLISGNNTISVYFQAPVGAGVISPDAEITAELYIVGDNVLGLPDNLSSALAQFSWQNILNSINTFFKNATLPTFAFLIIISIIIFGVAYIVTQTRPVQQVLARTI